MGLINGASLGELITIGIKEFSKELFQPIKNMPYFCKPSGGMWSSSYNVQDGYVSDWHRFCENMPNRFSKDSIVFKLKEDAKIYEIDTREDLEELINLVGINKEENSPLDGTSMLLEFPDFEKCAKMFDAIHLTSEGQWQTRGICYFGHNLYGWDVESILLLNPDIIKEWKYKHI